MTKNKELSYVQYWDVNNSYNRAMSEKIAINNFEWIKDTFHFNEYFVKTIMKGMKDIFLNWCSISEKITWTS